MCASYGSYAGHSVCVRSNVRYSSGIGVEPVCVLVMPVMLGIVTSVLNVRYLSGGRVVLGLRLLISGDSLDVWQVVVRERDIMTVSRGEGIPKMVLEVYDLQRRNVRHLD